VWSPSAKPTLVLDGRAEALSPREDGMRETTITGRAGDTYRFRLNGTDLPDPCSCSQPDGVRGPSAVVDAAAFDIRPGPRLELQELAIYELHVGTFSAEGTFDGVLPRLRGLRELGVTAIELMPVATFPGERGWGYDGVYSYAPHPAYGGPVGLARLVDAAHAEGLAVFLDVVYNHIGPGADAIGAFGPYFTRRYHTFWGDALDYSQRGVREWAIENAELWIRDYRVDGLRLDAVHSVFDDSPTHVLRELRDRVKAINPHAFVISEMGRDDFRPLDEWDHDAMWLDNLHHELHVALTGEHDGYYANFGLMRGLCHELERAQPERLVVCAQNHDQVGNRAVGDRLPRDAHRVALSVVLFSTATPLLFMGEEYDETRPFQFFTDHIDPFIAEATREGRKREFAGFGSFRGEVPDPQSPATFEASKLDPKPPEELYRRLLALRRELPRELDVSAKGKVLTMRRGRATLVADLERKSVELRA
jgi:maltooligosyltrehalose trehalohydrolase